MAPRKFGSDEHPRRSHASHFQRAAVCYDACGCSSSVVSVVFEICNQRCSLVSRGLSALGTSIYMVGYTTSSTRSKNIYPHASTTSLKGGMSIYSRLELRPREPARAFCMHAMGLRWSFGTFDTFSFVCDRGTEDSSVSIYLGSSIRREHESSRTGPSERVCHC